MVDFLIVIEHKARELENACLLAAELMDRGYSVKIKNVLSLSRYFISAEVVIAPHLYNDWQVVAIAKNFRMNNKKILDLQYEQVLSTKIKRNGIHNPKETATHAQHIAWGEMQVEKYLENGIDLCNIHKTGCVSMDLNMAPFDRFFKSRIELAAEFNMDPDKEWVLFISSFSYINKTVAEIKGFKKLNPDIEEFLSIMNASREPILQWLEKAVIEYQDKIFIYRKHPGESDDIRLINMAKKYKNFKCIDDYSIRQWIRSADKLYTWYSTSIVDAYFGGKLCEILRPIKIPDEVDVETFVNADYITKYEAFSNSLTNSKEVFPIAADVIKKYYCNSENNLAYLDVIEVCVSMLNNKNYEFDYNYGKSRLRILNAESLDVNIKHWITYLIFDVCQYIRLSWLFGRLLPESRIALLRRFEQEAYHIKKAEKDYIFRFREILPNLHNYANNYEG